MEGQLISYERGRPDKGGKDLHHPPGGAGGPKSRGEKLTQKKSTIPGGRKS